MPVPRAVTEKYRKEGIKCVKCGKLVNVLEQVTGDCARVWFLVCPTGCQIPEPITVDEGDKKQ